MTWFKRSDGVMFAADEGSASFNLMTADGAFEEVIAIVQDSDGEEIGLTGKGELWKDSEETTEKTAKTPSKKPKK